jgi:hypothetical protein
MEKINSENSKYIIGVLILILVASAIAIYAFQSNSLNCEKEYDAYLSDNITINNLPEQCKPVPSSVETAATAEELKQFEINESIRENITAFQNMTLTVENFTVDGNDTAN